MPRARRFRLRLFVKDEYMPLRRVPIWLWALSAAALAGQLFLHGALGAPQVSERGLQLQLPPSDGMLRLAALGDTPALSRIIMLNLQAFDNQQGVSISFRDLDRDLLALWLDRIVALDEKSEYPHFTAAKVYTTAYNDELRRAMAKWVRRQFRRSPDTRWEWMAHVTNMVRHVIKDDALSLEMARELRELTTPEKVPGWARQLEVFFLESKNEYESSAALLSNLLSSGEVSNPQEFSFLLGRLEDIVEKMVKKGEIRSQAEFNVVQERLQSLREQFGRQHAPELFE